MLRVSFPPAAECTLIAGTTLFRTPPPRHQEHGWLVHGPTVAQGNLGLQGLLNKNKNKIVRILFLKTHLSFEGVLRA